MSFFNEVKILNAAGTYIDENTPFAVREHSFISTGNSTTSNLLAGGVFTGTAVEVIQYGVISVAVYSDVASATDGLALQQSVNGTGEWHWIDNYTIPAGVGKTYQVQPVGDYFRVVYTNGAAPTTNFHIHVVLHPDYIRPSSHRIQDNISTDDDAELTKAVLTGQDPTGIFNNVVTTVDGDLRIADNSSGLAIAKGDITGSSFIHKFGLAADIDTADLATVWDGANNSLFAGSPPMLYTYSTAANIGTISSSSTGDLVDIEIQGLDTNYDFVTQTKTLTGQTDAALDTNLLRVFRMTNVGSTDLIGFVYLRTNGSAQTNGVPNTANTVRAIINNGNNQTLMCVYTVPNGFTGYMRDWYASTAGANKTSNYTVNLKSRPFGQVLQTKHFSAVADNGSSTYQHSFTEPEVFAAKTDIEIQTKPQAVGVTGAAIAAGFDIVLVAD